MPVSKLTRILEQEGFDLASYLTLSGPKPKRDRCYKCGTPRLARPRGSFASTIDEPPPRCLWNGRGKPLLDTSCGTRTGRPPARRRGCQTAALL